MKPATLIMQSLFRPKLCLYYALLLICIAAIGTLEMRNLKRKAQNAIIQARQISQAGTRNTDEKNELMGLPLRKLQDSELDIFPTKTQKPAAQTKPADNPAESHPLAEPSAAVTKNTPQTQTSDTPPQPAAYQASIPAMQYIGKLGDAGSFTVFVTLNNKAYAVKTGDIVNQSYRIDDIKPPDMAVTHVPTDTKQIIYIGAAN